MIGFGLRMTVGGGKEAVVRLVVTAAAVALGVGLLLVTLAGINATNAQNARYAWLNTGVAGTVSGHASVSRDPAWWLLRADYFAGQLIGRVDVAATGPDSPVPPGIPRLPGPGQFYASPALSALIRSTAPAELGDRFPGHQIGTIGPAALPAPDSLIIIVGDRPGRIARIAGATRVTSIATTRPSSCSGCQVGMNANTIDLILSVVAGALVFPVIILIATATRLAATRREQRFAAMRLVGATPGQVAVIAAVESIVAAVAGAAAGFGLFFLLRSPMAAVRFTSQPFFPSDLSLSAADVLLAAVGVPAIAAAAALRALRRVRISPLGVTRRVTPRPPRAGRLIPLAAGVTELGYFIGRRPATTSGQIQAYLPGFVLIMAGLVIAGPWLTMLCARLMAQRTGRIAALIAARRLADNPQSGFRAVSGLVLALFVTTVAVGVITTMDANREIPAGGPAVSHTLIDDFTHGTTASGNPAASAAAPSAALLARLHSIPGIRGVTVIHANPLRTKNPLGDDSTMAGLASCAQLAHTPGYGRCGKDVAVASVPPYFPDQQDLTRTAWPAAPIAASRLRDLPAWQILVATDGTTAAIEQARTTLALAYPGQPPASTFGEVHARSSRQLTAYQQLADVIIFASLTIAGCSLAVSIATAISDRKRPFSLLRLTGVPLTTLRRVVALETTAPLAAAAAVAIGTGLLAAALFLKSQMNYALRPPGTAYYVIILAGLAASLAVIASTLPLLNRITGPETARNE